MILIKATLKTCTPFMIGSGEDESSDSDILRDRDRKVYIPGTSLAGISRHFLESIGKNTDQIFGNMNSESRIKFFDAFAEGDVSTSVRDSVRLVDRISLDGSKFDYEIAEAGAEFTFKMELDAKDSDEFEICKTIIKGFKNGDIRIGGKTTRGFGVVDMQDVIYIDLGEDWEAVDKDLTDKELQTAVNENLTDEELQAAVNENLTDEELQAADHDKTIERKFYLKSFLFIRDYGSTKRVEGEGGKFVDAETLTNANGNPVIPGPSLAGALRSHSRKILKKAGYEGGDEEKIKEFINELFGYETDPDKNPEDSNKNTKDIVKTKSKLLVKECELNNDKIVFLNRTRTAIDRFSGSALQTGALFTGNIACKKDSETPEITITIKIKKDFSNMQLAESLINRCLDDLGNGILALGGNTGIGAGIFEKCEGE